VPLISEKAARCAGFLFRSVTIQPPTCVACCLTDAQICHRMRSVPGRG
jgi:hypothetical protein